MARARWRDQFEDGCFCLIELLDANHCRATIYIHMSDMKAWRVFETKPFKHSGLALSWASGIQPGIKCIKVQVYERN